MTEITQVITPLPTPPTRTDMESFDSRADAFLPAIVALGAEVGVWTGQANAVAAQVNQANTEAQSANAAAQAALVAAESVAGATAWDTGTAYAAGDCVYGSDGQTYRAMQSSTGTNPVTDTSGKWVRISATGSVYEDISPGGTFASGGYRLASTGSYTLPASPAKNVKLEFVLDCIPTESDKITISRGGKTIDSRAEDLTVEDVRVATWIMVYNGETWMVLV